MHLRPRSILALATLCWPGAVFGHGAAGGGDSYLALLLLAVTGGVYAAGFLRLAWRAWWSRGAVFLCGWLVLAGALIGPLEAAAQASLGAHMVQHMLLIAVVPPLLLWSQPLPVLLAGLPRPVRERLARPATRLYRTAAEWGLTAFLVHTAAVWIWHLPAAYQAALESALLHDLEHASFLFTALWLWWALIAPIRTRRGAFGPAVLLSVMTMAHMGLLGALLTFASRVLYAQHPTGLLGLSALEDQQLAGLIMWVPGGIIYTALGAALFAIWLSRLEQRGVSESARHPS